MLTSDSFQAKREILKFLYPGKTVFASLALLWPSLFASTFLCATLSLPPRTHGVVPHFSSRPPWPRALSAVLTLAVAAYAICLGGEAIVLAIKRETLRERTAEALLL